MTRQMHGATVWFSHAVLFFSVIALLFCARCSLMSLYTCIQTDICNKPHPMQITFFARDSIICYSAYAIARPSVTSLRLSVCLSVSLSHGWISQKRLKLGSCNFHHQVAPYDSSFLTVNFTPKFQGEHRERGRQIREG